MRNAKSKLFCRTISFSMIQFNTTFKEGCIRNSRHFFDFLISNCPRHLFVDSLIFYPCSRLRSEAVLRPARRCSLLTARCSLLTAHRLLSIISVDGISGSHRRVVLTREFSSDGNWDSTFLFALSDFLSFRTRYPTAQASSVVRKMNTDRSSSLMAQ